LIGGSRAACKRPGVPAVLPTLAIVAGAAAGSFHPSGLVGVAGVALMVLAAAAACLTLRRRHTTFLVAVTAAYCAAGAVLAGRAASHAFGSQLRAQHDVGVIVRGVAIEIEGRLLEDAAPTDYGASLLLTADRIRSAAGWRTTSGGVRLSVGGSLTREAHAHWRAGRRVRATASLRLPTGYQNPGARDEVAALARRGVALVGSVKSAALVEIVAPGHRLAESAASLRARVREAVFRRLGPEAPTSAAIVTAILIGDRAGLDPAVERRLQDAGTYHVIAISGGNIAVLAALTLALVRSIRAPGRSGPLAAIAALTFYGYVASGGPSVARATLAAVLYLAARALDLRTPPGNALAVTLAAAVLVSPLDLYDPGLALSFGATLALIVGADRIRVASAFGIRPSGVRRSCLNLGAATVCAEIAVLPLGALAFGRITAAGLALNFVAIPLMAVVQVAGLVLVCADSVLPPVSDLAARAVDLSASTVMASTALLDYAPWLTWRVPPPPWPLVVIYYAAWALVVKWGIRKKVAVPFSVAICTGLAIAAPPGTLHTPGTRHLPGTRHPSAHQAPGTRHPEPVELIVTILDVGQGDSILVSLPSGRHLLVDAGGAIASTFDMGGRVVAPALAALGVRRLHALAFTHPDPDHIGGAQAILRDFAPVEIWEGVPVPRHPGRRDLALEAARRQIGWRTLNAGARLTDGDVEIDVLHPPPPDWERQKTRNDDSLVLDVRLGDVSILLTGDIGRDVERALVPSLRSAAIRILKAAHHGSASSTSGELLRAARPSAVIFTAGRDNRFGHPAAAVIARVLASGAQIFRTDQDGAITISTDGRSVTVTSIGGRRWTRDIPAVLAR
jgi:competence protein ComEC